MGCGFGVRVVEEGHRAESVSIRRPALPLVSVVFPALSDVVVHIELAEASVFFVATTFYIPACGDIFPGYMYSYNFP